MTNSNQSAGNRFLRPRTLVSALIAIIFLSVSGYFTYTFAKRVAADNPIVAQPDIDETVPDTAVQTSLSAPVQSVTGSVEVAETEPEAEPIAVVQEPWSGTSRVTVLLMGIDRRCGEIGPVRTDSLMVVSIDPIGKTAAALSLPRDLWVEIPGFGVERINQAHYVGEIIEYPGGGPAMAVDTVEAILGTDIHHYATVNFQAFVEVVDLMDGITLTVPEPIDDPNYPDECYGFDPFSIAAGEQTLDGATALKYARTRATQNGDIARAGRQQAVVLAVRDAAVSQVAELVLKAPRFWDTMNENVSTTMQLEEALQLALLLPEIPRENIRQGVIGDDYVFKVQNADEQFVLVPRRQAIRDLRDELFALPGVDSVAAADREVRLREQFAAEDASIALYNGTQTFGLATVTEAWLNKQGVTIAALGNDDLSTNVSSRIIQFGDNPATVDLLVDLLDVPPLNVETGDVPPEPGIDVLVILGANWDIPAE